MDDVGVVEDGIDWESFFENIPQIINLFEEGDPLLTTPPPPPSSSSSSVDNFSNPSPDSAVSSRIGEIEHILMEDGDKVDLEPNHEFYNDFLADILVDVPSSDQSGDVATPDDEDHLVVSEANDTPEDEDGDPNSKKRKRQLRNKDAAVRSRERKKMYVRDLELKSRYLEGECRRLGQLLHCCYAENQALRLRLHSGSEASGASVTKQESAVLLLESLLLGSLLWFLGIVCLFHLPKMLQFPLEAVPLEGMERKNVARKGAGSKMCRSLITTMFNSRRCKASRTRMKPSFLVFQNFVLKVF